MDSATPWVLKSFLFGGGVSGPSAGDDAISAPLRTGSICYIKTSVQVHIRDLADLSGTTWGCLSYREFIWKFEILVYILRRRRDDVGLRDNGIRINIDYKHRNRSRNICIYETTLYFREEKKKNLKNPHDRIAQQNALFLFLLGKKAKAQSSNIGS